MDNNKDISNDNSHKWPYITGLLISLFTPLIVILGTNVLNPLEEELVIGIIGVCAVLAVVFYGIHMLIKKEEEKKGE